MENTKDYTMSSLEEYFELLDRETEKRSQVVAKSLVSYLQKNKESDKLKELKASYQ